MYKIFIVEDDLLIAQNIKKRLDAWDFETRVCANFRLVTSEFSEFEPDLVYIDIGLPYFDGYFWCAEIRKISSVPIIFISSASDNMNIVMAMNMGADDFIAKPFDLDVLTAKTKAVLRRTHSFAENSSVVEICGAMLDVASGELAFENKKVQLTKTEQRILYVLFENRNKVVAREKLMESLWQTDSFVDENALSVNIGRLRKKLEELNLNDFIKTKFGQGYYICDKASEL